MGCRPCCSNHFSGRNFTVEFTKTEENLIGMQKGINNNNAFFSSNSIPRNKIKYYLEIWEQINLYRKRHNVNPLTINNDICILSQKHSDKIARENYIELSNNKYNEMELGEIIFCFNEKNSPLNIISSFYEEESNKYDYTNANPPPSNFTQMIWKNSQYIGIGCSKTRENLVYTVINFFPPGNIQNEFLSNVLPPSQDDNVSTMSKNSEMKLKFLEDLFNRNNEYREKHGVPLLSLNPSLTTKAAEYAQIISENNKYLFSDIKFMGDICGKNLCIMENEGCDGKKVCDKWYSEIKDYDFGNDGKNDKQKIKNFAQLIWKDTKEVGFGWHVNKEGVIYIVGLYYPCGNIERKYSENVLPPENDNNYKLFLI